MAIQHRQPAHVTRKRLDPPPTQNYAIIRDKNTKKETIIGYTRKEREDGTVFLVKRADVEEFAIRSAGESPHNKAEYWLDGDPGVRVENGLLIGSPYAWEEEDLPQAIAKVASEAAVEALERQGGERGQGFKTNAKIIKAIDSYAMKKAQEYYESKGWKVDPSVHKKKNLGYDLECKSKSGSQVLHVEVKATQTNGVVVIVTPSEKRHSEGHEDAALFVLYGIHIKDDGADPPEPECGKLRELNPWNPANDSFAAVTYRYTLPPRNPS